MLPVRFSRLLFLSVLATGLCACGSEERAPQGVVQREALNLTAQRPGESGAPTVVRPQFLSDEEMALRIELPPRVEVPRPVEPAVKEPVVADETEPNNDAGAAQTVAVHGTVRGSIGPNGEKGGPDHDWYRLDVDLEHPRVLQLDLSPAGKLDLSLELYREGLKGRELLVSLNNSGKGRGEKLPNFRLANGSYFLHVYPVGKKVAVSKPQSYTLTLVLEEARAGVETEPNDDHLKAELLTLPARVSGVMQRADDQDWFQADLLKVTPGTSRLAVELLPPVGAGLVLSIHTQSRDELLSVATAKGKKLVIPNVAVLDGSSSYYLRVSAPEGGKPIAGEYSLAVEVQPLQERTEVEPDGTPEQALRLYLDEALSGWLAFEGDEDWFRIEPPDLSMPDDDAGAEPGAEGAGQGAPDAGAASAGEGAAAGGPGAAGAPAEAPSPDPEDEHPAFRLQLTGVPGIDPVLELFEEDGRTPLGRYDTGGKGEGEVVPNLALPVHPIVVRLSGAGLNAGATYTLQSSLVQTKGMELEPNNRPEDATLLVGASRQMKGYLALAGDTDCIRLEAPVPRLTVTPPRNVDMTVSFYDGPDKLVEQVTGKSGEPVRPERGGQNATVICVQLSGTAQRGAGEPWILVVELDEAP